jgi:hypothetical protein
MENESAALPQTLMNGAGDGLEFRFADADHVNCLAAAGRLAGLDRNKARDQLTHLAEGCVAHGDPRFFVGSGGGGGEQAKHQHRHERKQMRIH